MKIQVLKRQRIITPLGLRFRDIVTNNPITSGLIVTARLKKCKWPVVKAQVSPSGVYTFHHLPGLRDIEYSDDDLDQTDFPNGQKKYVICIKDTEERYLSAGFIISAPQFGIYPNSHMTDSPPVMSAFKLFSNPIRSAPAGYAEVRADLWDIIAEKPATNALLEIQSNSTIYSGLSDAQGKAVVMFPYPEVDVVVEGSPTVWTKISLSAQKWPVKIRVHYSPRTVKQIREIGLSNYRTVLEQQYGLVYEDENPSEWLDSEIGFNKALIVRTLDKSVLEVQADDSSP